jgi:hypothetical protein
MSSVTDGAENFVRAYLHIFFRVRDPIIFKQPIKESENEITLYCIKPEDWQVVVHYDKGEITVKVKFPQT